MVVFRRQWRFIPVPSDLSPSLSTTVAVYRPPWSISPMLTGSVLKPTLPDLCNLHRVYMNEQPTEDVCAQLPFSIVGERRWNLPEEKAYLLHSRRAGVGEENMAVEGTKAYWSFSSSCPIADELGEEIGMCRFFTLFFGEEIGMWNMEEFTCSEKINGDFAIVLLRCTNEKLKRLEEKVLLGEYDISYRLQQNCRKNFKTKGDVDYSDDVSCLVQILGSNLVEFNEVRMMCIEREKRMGWGVTVAEIDDVAVNDGNQTESQLRVLFVPGPGRYT